MGGNEDISLIAALLLMQAAPDFGRGAAVLLRHKIPLLYWQSNRSVSGMGTTICRNPGIFAHFLNSYNLL